MKSSFKLLILALIQYFLFFLFILLVPGTYFKSFNYFNLSIDGEYIKWQELLLFLIPLLVIVVYAIEDFYYRRREKLSGTPQKNKKVIKVICEVFFMLSSFFSWLDLVIQNRLIRGEYNYPWFFIISFIFSLFLIVFGKTLLRSLKGECVGINFPILTRDHSIWRRVNCFIGKFLMTGGFVYIVCIISYELFKLDVFVIIAFILLILLSIVIPFIYCLYLNFKSKK